MISAGGSHRSASERKDSTQPTGAAVAGSLGAQEISSHSHGGSVKDDFVSVPPEPDVLVLSWKGLRGAFTILTGSD